MSDLASRLLAAIEQEEQDAPNIHHKDCRAMSYVGVTEGAECDCGKPAAVLRRCALDRDSVNEWVEQNVDPGEGRSDDWLHNEEWHPAYEYRMVEGWYDSSPWKDEAGWELNINEFTPNAREIIHDRDFQLWRRLRPDGPKPWAPTIPYWLKNLARGYGLSVEEETTHE